MDDQIQPGHPSTNLTCTSGRIAKHNQVNKIQTNNMHSIDQDS